VCRILSVFQLSKVRGIRGKRVRVSVVRGKGVCGPVCELLSLCVVLCCVFVRCCVCEGGREGVSL